MGTIRTLLAFSVMAWHLRPAGYTRLTLLEGGLAVTTFFILSGFYMSMIIDEKYAKLPDGRRRFFINRFLRIFPLYFVVMALQALVFAHLGVKTVFTSDLGCTGVTRFSLIAMNLVKFGQDYWQTLSEHIQTNVRLGTTDELQRLCSGIFGAKAFEYQPGALLVAQGWSLGSELTYYLLAPLVAAAGWRLLSTLGVGSILIRVAFSIALGSAYMGSWRTKFFPSELVFFLLGHLAWRLHQKAQSWSFKHQLANVAVAAWVGVFACALFQEGFLLGREYDSPTMWAFYIFVTVTAPFVFMKTKQSRWDNFIGSFSYPVYLVHPIVIQLVLRHVAGGKTVHYVWLVAGVLAVSWVLINVVERPFERLRSKIGSGAAFRGIAAVPLPSPEPVPANMATANLPEALATTDSIATGTTPVSDCPAPPSRRAA